MRRIKGGGVGLWIERLAWVVIVKDCGGFDRVVIRLLLYANFD